MELSPKPLPLAPPGVDRLGVTEHHSLFLLLEEVGFLPDEGDGQRVHVQPAEEPDRPATRWHPVRSSTLRLWVIAEPVEHVVIGLDANRPRTRSTLGSSPVLLPGVNIYPRKVAPIRGVARVRSNQMNRCDPGGGRSIHATEADSRKLNGFTRPEYSFPRFIRSNRRRSSGDVTLDRITAGTSPQVG